MLLKINLLLNALNKPAQFSQTNITRNKKNDGGFTLVELTIILMIITILSAIALPEFARCRPYKAMQSEAKQYVGSMNRAQQAYFAEKGTFSTSLDALGLGIKSQTTNYNYSTISTKNAAFSYGVSIRETKELTSYVGAVFLVPVSKAANKEKTTVGILCEANSPGKTQLPAPILQNGNPVCAAGSSLVTK